MLLQVIDLETEVIKPASLGEMPRGGAARPERLEQLDLRSVAGIEEQDAASLIRVDYRLARFRAAAVVREPPGRTFQVGET